MNFETEYKNITFNISLDKEDISDVSLLMGDKFNRLPNQTMIEIKKGNLESYNLVIKSSDGEHEFTHYLSGVLLTSQEDDLMDELAEYLESEEILDNIIEAWARYLIEPGPAWKI
jgi:hypothetical protein